MSSVLILDDDIVLAEMYQYKFSRRGWQAKIAQSVDEALKLCSLTDFDVILIDILMPKKNGLQFIKSIRLKKLQTEADCYFISNLSPITFDLNNRVMKSLGMRGYFTKLQTSPTLLIEAIEYNLLDKQINYE